MLLFSGICHRSKQSDSHREGDKQVRKGRGREGGREEEGNQGRAGKEGGR
jgi:hypothetical protein